MNTSLPEFRGLVESARCGGWLEKLALADWLEEHGQERHKFRAHLLRLQVMMEKMVSGHGEGSPDSFQEMQEAYDQAWNEWRTRTLAFNAEHGSPVDSEEESWLASPTIDLPLGAYQTMRFAWVPAGTSWLGGGSVYDDEESRPPQPGKYSFTLRKALWCGIYPVTQAEWQSVMGNNPSHFMDRPSNPVEMVSWDDVEVFLEKLNDSGPAKGLSFRLPNEPEWEYICRGGPLSRDESMYDFTFAKSKADLTPVRSNELSSYQANFDGKYPTFYAKRGPYLASTSPVGSYTPNPLGIYDMHGNVWEWMSMETLVTVGRPIRGGGWNYGGPACATVNRDSFHPRTRHNNLGFRLLAVATKT
ncbi:MAG: SUMF1/EgtB/PvdO family nonheme iron enzyme [Gemmataceae bacterium]